MKKYIFGLAALALMVSSCDPIKTEVKPKDIISADAFKTVVTAKGENNNNITVTSDPVHYIHCYSSVDGQTWEEEGEGLKVDIQMLPPAGQIMFKVETMLSDGTIITSAPSEPVKYSEFTDLPVFLKELFNYDAATDEYSAAVYEFSKTAPFVYGAGSYLDPGQTIKTGPWWGVTLGELGEANATMDLAPGKISTSLGTSGGLKIKEKPFAQGVDGAQWNIGHLKVGTPVLHGEGGWGEGEFLEYQILDASNGELFLGHPDDGFSGGAWSTCWYWLFSKK